MERRRRERKKRIINLKETIGLLLLLLSLIAFYSSLTWLKARGIAEWSLTMLLLPFIIGIIAILLVGLVIFWVLKNILVG